MAVKDVQVIDAARAINNFNIYVKMPSPTGYQTVSDHVVNTPAIADIQEKYEQRFSARDDTMSRSDHYFDVVIAAGEQASEGFSIANYSFGSFEVVSAFTGPSLNFETKMRESSNWETARDSSGAALTGVAVTTGTVIPISSDVLFADMMRFSAASGQGSDTIIRCILKG